MPELGEVRKGKEIGFRGRVKFIWSACRVCGKERWAVLEKGKPSHSRCKSCYGDYCRRKWSERRGVNNPRWKGGRMRSVDGYIKILLQPSDFFYPMCDDRGYVYEHRLLIAKGLGRCLNTTEVVHHLNGIRNDNRPSNLVLLPDTKHRRVLAAKAKRIQQLEALLKQQGQLC